MSLIEKYGSYELALKLRERIATAVGFTKTKTELEAALLEYRRANNIFEVGDLIVFDITKPFCGLMQPDLMEILNPKYQEHDMIVRIDNQAYAVGGKAVRHATDEEIKAGHRL